MKDIVPVPVEVKPTGEGYTVTEETAIHVGSEAATGIAEYLAGLLRPSTGYDLPIVESPPPGPTDSVSLRLDGAPDEVGE